MRRLLALWLVLALSFWTVRIVLALALVQPIDLTYRAFLELLIVPGLQAAAVIWATRPKTGVCLLAPWRLAWSHRALRLVLAADLAIAVAAWTALVLGAGSRPNGGLAPWVGGLAGTGAAPVQAAPPIDTSAGGFLTFLSFARPAGAPRLAIFANLAAAALVLAAVAGTGRARRTGTARLAAAALAAAAGLLAIEPLTGWLGGAPYRLFPDEKLIFQWLRFYPALSLAALLLLLIAQAAWRAGPPAVPRVASRLPAAPRAAEARQPEPLAEPLAELPYTAAHSGALAPGGIASRALDWVIAALVVLAAIAAGGFFLHPYLREPWRSAAWTAAFFATVALLIAAVQLATSVQQADAAEP